MRLDEFAVFMADICSHSSVAQGRPLRWTIIANPMAGGFTISSRWKRHKQALTAAAGRAKARNPFRPESGPSGTARAASGGKSETGLIVTGGPGHAGRIVEALVAEAAGSFAAIANGAVAANGDTTAGGAARPLYVVVCAGGDGTSLEALSALYAAPEEIRDHFVALRLPLGTGNDGADSWELGEALELLIVPTRIERTAALRLSTANPAKGFFLAFNILSVGLDAFVTHMTNKMKGKLPGDSYKLWVDIASLLYDRIYHVGPMDVRAGNASGKTVQNLRETVLLLAMGVSGHRTYGARKYILPDDRNVCLVRQMSLFRKVALKDLFTTGRHVDKKESLLFNANRVEFTGEYPILAQMDGETVRLEPPDFPGVIELTEPVIPILKRL
jgi:diacylglycerol kinase family enzyme